MRGPEDEDRRTALTTHAKHKPLVLQTAIAAEELSVQSFDPSPCRSLRSMPCQVVHRWLQAKGRDEQFGITQFEYDTHLGPPDPSVGSVANSSSILTYGAVAKVSISVSTVTSKVVRWCKHRRSWTPAQRGPLGIGQLAPSRPAGVRRARFPGADSAGLAGAEKALHRVRHPNCRPALPLVPGLPVCLSQDRPGDRWRRRLRRRIGIRHRSRAGSGGNFHPVPGGCNRWP